MNEQALKRQTAKRQEGQDLVEYALALPIMLLFLMVILDMGRVVYVYSALHNSVRDGARYGIINPTDVITIETVVRARAVGLDPAELTVFVVQPDLQTIQVRAIYQFKAVTPIVGTLVGSNQWAVGSQATMRVEG
jgi:Flp pilus assembly protein TadG